MIPDYPRRKMAKTKNKFDVIPSSGNAFADLGLPNSHQERRIGGRFLKLEENLFLADNCLGLSNWRATTYQCFVIASLLHYESSCGSTD
jgi:hypothetical protein